MADRAEKCAEEIHKAMEFDYPDGAPTAWMSVDGMAKVIRSHYPDDLELLEAAEKLLDACLKADANEDLPPEIDGSLLDAVRTAIERRG